jgi:hypothetical protein
LPRFPRWGLLVTKPTATSKAARFSRLKRAVRWAALFRYSLKLDFVCGGAPVNGEAFFATAGQPDYAAKWEGFWLEWRKTSCRTLINMTRSGD